MSNVLPKNNWFVAGYSHEVRKEKTLKRIILKENIVLYRGQDNNVYALNNICPHKNVELSLGKIVDSNSIQCPYHGWKFNSQGNLTHIPCQGKDEKIFSCKTNSYPIKEQDGYIWIWMDTKNIPTTVPPSYPMTHGYYWYEFNNTMDCSADLILENGLDCAHTGFVHTGLFRSTPSHYVQAVIEKKATGLKVETIGEKKNNEKNLLSFLSSNEEIIHFDEYIAPHTVYVNYDTSQTKGITILICTPETDGRTRVYTRMATKFRFFNKLQGFVVKQVVKKVIKQDKKILNNQQQVINELGKRSFCFSKSDLATRLFFKAYNDVQENKPLWSGEYGTEKVTYKL